MDILNVDIEKLVFRLQKIPSFIETSEDVARVLGEALGDISQIDVVVQSLATSLSPWGSSPTRVATLMFKRVPRFLAQKPTTDGWPVDFDTSQPSWLDTNFLGLTPLNDVGQSDHVADCIAISGLSSHPFGSWQPKGRSKTFMWIRDRLPQALPGTRMVLYGYDSSLEKSGSFQQIDDLARGLLQHLHRLRGARSLMFLAHSLGGLLLKKSSSHAFSAMRSRNCMPQELSYHSHPNAAALFTLFRLANDALLCQAHIPRYLLVPEITP